MLEAFKITLTKYKIKYTFEFIVNSYHRLTAPVSFRSQVHDKGSAISLFVLVLCDMSFLLFFWLHVWLSALPLFAETHSNSRLLLPSLLCPLFCFLISCGIHKPFNMAKDFPCSDRLSRPAKANVCLTFYWRVENSKVGRVIVFKTKRTPPTIKS